MNFYISKNMNKKEPKSAYSILSNQRELAKNKLRDLIVSSASKKEIKEAQAAFDALDEKVKKIDRAVGDYSKEVGNYSETNLSFFRFIGVYFLFNKIWNLFK